MSGQLLQEIETSISPEALAELLQDEPGLVLLRTAMFESPHARYSFVAVRPFLTFRSWGSRCELESTAGEVPRFGNPWRVLDELMARYELLDEADLPFPLGGCFGYWGYDLKNFVEPKLRRSAVNDLELPDCHVGFYESLVVFDHRLNKTWIVATGLAADGSRSDERAHQSVAFWREALCDSTSSTAVPRKRATRGSSISACWADLRNVGRLQHSSLDSERLRLGIQDGSSASVTSTFTRAGFIAGVERALDYIRRGHIYQVNLSQRLTVAPGCPGWELFQRLSAVSPAPFAAFLDCGEFQIASSSPELFLRLSGSQIITRPIKGTRPRDSDPTRDAQLTYELQTSAKEMAELVMITDLLRNDLGRVCEYGTVHVPELVRLERFAQVQHLVSTVEGQLRKDVSHFAAFASCFPGGSITGAPKFRAMEIIDELEPVTRGPYTGAVGYLGFNRESQLSIAIRTALCTPHANHFQAGAGIVTESDPATEYEETLAKAGGFLAALNRPRHAKFPTKPIS